MHTQGTERPPFSNEHSQPILPGSRQHAAVRLSLLMLVSDAHSLQVVEALNQLLPLSDGGTPVESDEGVVTLSAQLHHQV